MSINIRDANEVNLLTGATLTAGADTTGTAVALYADATAVTFVLSILTTGTTNSSVEIEVSYDNSTYRSLGTFDVITSPTHNATTRYLDLFIPGAPGTPTTPPVSGAIWVRAHVITGGSAVLTGSTLRPRIAGYGRNDPTRMA